MTTPLQALAFIFNQPHLLGLSLAPILAAIISFALLIYALLTGLWTLAHSTYLAAVSNYSGFVFVIVSLLVLSALSFFAVSLLTFLMSLFASPFNDFLAEKTEREWGIQDVPHWSVGRMIRVLWIDLRKSMITIFATVVFSLGLLLPVANILFFVGLALLNTFTFITYPQSRREWGLLKSLMWIREHFFLSLGFGVSTLLLFSIPVVGFFALPLSVVGGTLLFCESLKVQN